MTTFTKPTSATLTATTAALRNYSTLTKEYVQDVRVKELWHLPSLNAAGPADLISMGAGTVDFEEVNTAEIGGIKFDSDTDSYSVFTILPHDLDPDQDVDFRVLWSNSEAAGTGSCLFIVTYKTYIFGGTTAVAAATTVLDSPIPVQVDLAANVAQWSAYGTISAGKLSSLCPGTDGLIVKVAVDVTSIANASAYQCQMRYRRRYL